MSHLDSDRRKPFLETVLNPPPIPSTPEGSEELQLLRTISHPSTMSIEHIVKQPSAPSPEGIEGSQPFQTSTPSAPDKTKTITSTNIPSPHNQHMEEPFIPVPDGIQTSWSFLTSTSSTMSMRYLGQPLSTPSAPDSIPTSQPLQTLVLIPSTPESIESSQPFQPPTISIGSPYNAPIEESFIPAPDGILTPWLHPTPTTMSIRHIVEQPSAPSTPEDIERSQLFQIPTPSASDKEPFIPAPDGIRTQPRQTLVPAPPAPNMKSSTLSILGLNEAICEWTPKHLSQGYREFGISHIRRGTTLSITLHPDETGVIFILLNNRFYIPSDHILRILQWAIPHFTHEEVLRHCTTNIPNKCQQRGNYTFRKMAVLLDSANLEDILSKALGAELPPFQCYCGKRYIFIRDLNKHLGAEGGKHRRIDQDNYPYKCTGCGAGFSEKSYLRKHQRASCV